jgi:hypothetical protein
MFLRVQSQSAELPLHGIHSLELPASEIAAQINASQSSCNRHLKINSLEETV